MTYDEFISACDESTEVQALTPPLVALRLDRGGDWDAAHRTVQDIPSREASLVHAYLHRKEGDLANAGYWYRRAGSAMPSMSLAEEWDALARSLCD